MPDYTEATAQGTSRRSTVSIAPGLNKLVLEILLVAIGAALPASAFADNAINTHRYAAMEKPGSAAKSEKNNARTLLFQAAIEELRKNPQAADLPECPAVKAASTGLCAPKPAAVPTHGKSPA